MGSFASSDRRVKLSSLRLRCALPKVSLSHVLELCAWLSGLSMLTGGCDSRQSAHPRRKASQNEGFVVVSGWWLFADWGTVATLVA